MPADDGDLRARRTVLYPDVLVDYRIEEPPPEPKPQRWRVPLLLFIATCLSTFFVGYFGRQSWSDGFLYAGSLMTILLAHELGHYFQARRYGVPASLPYFIPMPITLIGTMGAIIAMRPKVATTKALFDLAITGPIAGLIPSLVLSFVGLKMSTISVLEESGDNFIRLGEPLVFKFLSHLALGPLTEGQDVTLHPVAFAGWVGIFITALNLIPISQLDGGHILYTLVPRLAYPISVFLLASAIVGVVASQQWGWSLMILLLMLIGARHPPTADGARLDPNRAVLGWLMLTFLLFGFTPQPFIF
jgi:membrane-associated protease RseP (regulator of RpoE activity)